MVQHIVNSPVTHCYKYRIHLEWTDHTVMETPVKQCYKKEMWNIHCTHGARPSLPKEISQYWLDKMARMSGSTRSNMQTFGFEFIVNKNTQSNVRIWTNEWCNLLSRNQNEIYICIFIICN